MSYTHFYELYKRVPRARRKRLAKFIHELKKLSGRKYHCNVIEMLEGCDEDYLSIETTKLSISEENTFEEELNNLCDEYSIPRQNVEYDMEPLYTDERGFTIHLYTDF